MTGRSTSATLSTYNRPAEILMGPSRIKVFCCEDPDVVVIEFMEFVRG